MDQQRIRILKKAEFGDGPIVYWMIRDHRVRDNWALLYAQEIALERRQQLVVVTTPSGFVNVATHRQYAFLFDGLSDLLRDLKALNILFYALVEKPDKALVRFVSGLTAGGLVCDFSPLRSVRNAVTNVTKQVNIPVYLVDAHNIVPCWKASNKREYAAYTIRPKINGKVAEFLTEFPKMKRHPYGTVSRNDSGYLTEIRKRIDTDDSAAPVDRLTPGERPALIALEDFLDNRLGNYHEKRNDPSQAGQSDLSPYLHFGQLAPQRVALEVQKRDENIKSQESYLEELVVRRELSDNFCYYCDDYDSVDGFADWSRSTLAGHQNDPREYIYDIDQFEAAETHDELWNAAQREMAASGKMHGYMRMYWAKKILEWTPAAPVALDTAIYLNDKYSLDGNDPNGYTGVAWSIGGVHDRPWFEREIFGKIRYMSYGGCRRKFDVRGYIERVNRLSQPDLQ